MKALIVVAAATLAFPVYAQQKQDVPQTLPSAQERAENREKVKQAGGLYILRYTGTVPLD